jgi:hypothetical protein
LGRPRKTIDQPAKTELFSRHNRRRLNTVGAIASEQGKIYRAAASGAIETGEAMRLSCILRELRAALEAANAAAIIDVPAGSSGDINVYAIPHGVQFSADGQTLVWPATGAPAEPLPFTPAQGTPDWTRSLTDQCLEPIAPQPIIEVDMSNVVRLERRDEDDPAGAA